METLLKTAKLLNLTKQYNELLLWNNKQNDLPLNDFNEGWLKKNAIIESDYLYSLAITIKNELSYEHALIICTILADYDVIYAKLFVAEYYELNNNKELALKYYKECLDDFEAHNLAKTKIEQISSK